MKRFSISISMATSAVLTLSLIAMAGCKTTLNGGANEGGGDQGGGDAVDGPSSGWTGTTGPTSTGAGGTFVTGSSSGGSGVCPAIEGVPDAIELLETDDFFLTAHANDDALYLTGHSLVAPAVPPRFLELDKDTGEILVSTPVEGEISGLTEHGGVLYGSGRCNAGGDPYRIGLPGPTLEALADGCEINPTYALVPVGGGIAYGTHDGQTGEVRWAPLDGEGPVRVLATFPTVGDEFGPFIENLATDGTAVYANAYYSGTGFTQDQSWSEIWRLPLDGGSPTRVVSTIPSYLGIVAGIVVDGDSLYFAEMGSATVWRIGTGGGEATLLWQGSNRIAQLVEVGSDLAFYDLTVPLPSTCEPILRRLPKTGGEAAAVAVLPNFPAWNLASDGTDLFFTGSDSRRINDDNATFPTMIYRTSSSP